MTIGSEPVPAAPARAAGAARLLPAATTALAALLTLEPVPLPGYAALTPTLTLMVVYHWTLYRPDLLPPLVLFAVGLGYDLAAGEIVGVTPLLLLLARAAVLRSRPWFIRRGFVWVWAGFAVLAAGILFGQWVIASLLAWRLLGTGAIVFRAALSVALFPLASRLLGYSQQALLGAG